MAAPSPVASPRRSLRLWLFAALPLLPLALVFWAWRLPAAAADTTLPLVGPWEGRAATAGVDPFAPGAEGWQALRLPGAFSPQGLADGHLWLRRRFTPPPAVLGHDAAFVVGSVRGAALRLFVNGEAIGVKGEPAVGFIGVEAGAETFFVPARLLRDGENVLALEVLSMHGGRDGITDSRLLFGRRDVLGPWSFHEQQVRAVLEQGVLVLIAGLLTLLGVLWGLQGGRGRRDLYRSSAALLASAALYLLGKSGFLVSALAPARSQVLLIVCAVFLMAAAIVEFVEAYYLQRATRLRWVSRGVSAAALLLTVTGLGNVYRAFTLWLFTLVVYSLVLAVRDLVKGLTAFGPLVGTATLIVAAAGISDLLGDLDVVYAPRLFTFAVANLALMSGAVVVGEFLALAQENTRLSTSLQERAEQLSDALVSAEAASRVKSEFLANTSHELRTPLNAIINIPQGLLEQFHETARVRCEACGAQFELEAGEAPPAAGEPCPECAAPRLAPATHLAMDLAPEETRRLLGSVVRSGTHLLAVVNDILDYSKLEAGRVVLHRERVPAAALLEDLRLAMEPVADRAGVRLVVEAAVDGFTLDADRVKLSQVLINLVGNAIKFSDGRGTVTVRGEVLPGGERLRLSVRDEGIGIAPEHQALIFEGFRQVESSNTRRFGGSGLGLAISKRLVTMHGGTLAVQSAPGQGSTFVAELPRVAAVVAEEVVAPDARVVVVVDDEASAVDATSVALRPLGCRVLGVSDPREALERLRASRPALVVLDVMLPRVSGLELLRSLKADPELQGLPVLVSSAYPDNQRAAEALGAVFVAKPWRPGELLRVATGLLASGPGKAERSPP